MRNSVLPETWELSGSHGVASSQQHMVLLVGGSGHAPLVTEDQLDTLIAAAVAGLGRLHDVRNDPLASATEVAVLCQETSFTSGELAASSSLCLCKFGGPTQPPVCACVCWLGSECPIHADDSVKHAAAV